MGKMNVNNPVSGYFDGRWLLIFGLLLLFSASVAAAGEVGKFTVVKGSVDSLRELADVAIPAQIGMGAFMQDIIRTKHRSRTQLKLIDNSVLNMGPDYMMEINEYVFHADKKVRKGTIEALRGKVRAIVAKVAGASKDSHFEIHTPTAIAAARGTEFIVNVISSLKSEIIVLEGIVAVRNIDPRIKGEVLLKAGQYTQVSRGHPPALPIYMPSAQIRLLVSETSVDGANSIPLPGGTTPPSTDAHSTGGGTTPPSTGAHGTGGSAAPTIGTTITTAELAPVPPPPAIISLLQQNPVPPIMRRAQLIDAALPPVQPPVTETFSSLLFTPVNLLVQF